MTDDTTDTEDLHDRVSMFLRRNFPQIRMHGGDAAIENINPDNGVVTIRLGGACSGCGISPMTIQALQNRLTQEIPEIDDVRAYTGAEDDPSTSSFGQSEQSHDGDRDSTPDAPF